MKKSLWILSALALVGFSMVGCGGDDDACDGTCTDTQACVTNNVGASKCMETDDVAYTTCNGVVGKVLNEEWLCVDNTSDFTTGCQSNNDCTNPDLPVCSDNVCVAADASEPEYKYVMIQDMSTSGKGEDLGADVDAVVLTKSSDNSQYYATAVTEFSFGSELINSSNKKDKYYAADPEKIKGAPDSLINYGKSADSDVCYYFKADSNSAGNSECDPSKARTCENCECDYDYTFVSLGGEGGYIIVEMGSKIEAGDKLDIIEVGDCKLTNTSGKKASDGTTTTATAENMTVQVSVSGNKDGTWKVLGSNKATKGVYSLTVSESALNK